MVASTPANRESAKSITRISGAAVSMYHLVKVGTDGRVTHTAAGDDALGSIMSDADQADRAVAVDYTGRTLVILGGSVAAGGRVQAGDDGVAIALAGGADLGQCLEGGVINDIASVLLDKG